MHDLVTLPSAPVSRMDDRADCNDTKSFATTLDRRLRMAVWVVTPWGRRVCTTPDLTDVRERPELKDTFEVRRSNDRVGTLPPLLWPRGVMRALRGGVGVGVGTTCALVTGATLASRDAVDRDGAIIGAPGMPKLLSLAFRLGPRDGEGGMPLRERSDIVVVDLISPSERCAPKPSRLV